MGPKKEEGGVKEGRRRNPTLSSRCCVVGLILMLSLPMLSDCARSSSNLFRSPSTFFTSTTTRFPPDMTRLYTGSWRDGVRRTM